MFRRHVTIGATTRCTRRSSVACAIARRTETGSESEPSLRCIPVEMGQRTNAPHAARVANKLSGRPRYCAGSQDEAQRARAGTRCPKASCRRRHDRCQKGPFSNDFRGLPSPGLGWIGAWRIGSDGLRLFLVAQGEHMQPRDHRHAGEEQRGAQPKRTMNIRVAYEP